MIREVALLLLAAAFQGVLRDGDETGPSAPGAAIQDGDARGSVQAVGAESEGDEVGVDERYRMLCKDLERFQAIWNQQPGNRKSLQREVARLEQHVSALRRSLTKSAKNGPEGEHQQPPSTAAGGSVRPNGPVRPAETPPTEEQIQRYLEALEKTYLPGPPLHPESSRAPTLADVPNAWLVKLCDLASVELKKISRLVNRSPIPASELEQSVGRLTAILHGMERPPPNAARIGSSVR